MALIAMCSAKGSPGVTTTALAFTLSWKRRLVLAECDPAGGDLAAGYLREVRLDGRGLGRLTASLARRRLADDLWTQLVDLAPRRETALTRLALPGLTDPAQAAGWAQRFQRGEPTGWEQLAGLFAAMATAGGGFDVIADCGRLVAEHSPLPVLAAAEVVLLVVRPTLPAARAASVALVGLAALSGAPVGLVTVGPGGYGSREFAAELGVPLVAAMPYDPAAARLGSGAARHPGRLLRFAARIEPAVWRLAEAGRADRRSHQPTSDREAQRVR